MKRRNKKPSRREIQRRREQSFKAKGGSHLSDFKGGSVKAVPLKGQKGYEIK